MVTHPRRHTPAAAAWPDRCGCPHTLSHATATQAPAWRRAQQQTTYIHVQDLAYTIRSAHAPPPNSAPHWKPARAAPAGAAAAPCVRGGGISHAGARRWGRETLSGSGGSGGCEAEGSGRGQHWAGGWGMRKTSRMRRDETRCATCAAASTCARRPASRARRGGETSGRGAAWLLSANVHSLPFGAQGVGVVSD